MMTMTTMTTILIMITILAMMTKVVAKYAPCDMLESLIGCICMEVGGWAQASWRLSDLI